jgi:hypothetical protein
MCARFYPQLSDNHMDATTPLDPEGFAPAPPPAPIRSLDSGRPPASQPPTGDPPNADPWSTLPPKFHVKTATGELDRDASFAKLSQAHRALEQRLGTATGRPATAEAYTIETPAALTGALDVASPQFKAFRDEAFEQGFSPSQLQFVIDKYAEAAPQLVAGARTLDHNACTAELEKVWPNADVFNENIGLADRAVKQFGGDLGEPLLRSLRDNAPAIQFLARIGAELREDTPPSPGVTPAPAGVDALMRHPAYSNASHPEHAAVTAKVNAFYSRQPGANSPL